MSDRQTGRTTKQMREAPERAVFVWPVAASLGYAKRLANVLCRADLEIVLPVWLEERRYRGLRRAVILDHATSAFMTPEQHRAWVECSDYLAMAGVA